MFNKTMLKNKAFKNTMVMTAIASLFLVGCGSDQNYKREVDGNEDYLNSPVLKPLTVPQGVTVPAESSEYYIHFNKNEGAVYGKQVDIRAPIIPIPTIPDSYASYNYGTASLNAPADANVWSVIPTALNRYNIPISSSDNNAIVTGNASIFSSDEEPNIQASYVIHRQNYSGTENIIVELKTLTRGTQDISSNPIEVQRYVVRLFNLIMDEAAPKSSQVVQEQTDENAVEDKSTHEDSK